MANVDLNLLRVLDAVFTEGGVGQAAKKLGLSQSAVSHALGRLREATSDPLFVRVGNNMEPTPRALALRDRVRRALADLDQAFQPVVFDPHRPREFRLFMADYAGMMLLPPLLATCIAEAPGVDIRVVPSSGRGVHMLERGEVDLCCGLFGGMGEEVDRADLYLRTLWRDRLVCMLRKDHPALAAWDLDRFLATPHIQIAPRGRPGGVFDDHLQQLGLKRRVVLAVPTFLTVPAVVAATDALALMPEQAARRLAPMYGLEIRESPIPAGGFAISQLFHARDLEDAAHLWLREQVRRTATILAGPGPEGPEEQVSP